MCSEKTSVNEQTWSSDQLFQDWRRKHFVLQTCPVKHKLLLRVLWRVTPPDSLPRHDWWSSDNLAPRPPNIQVIKALQPLQHTRHSSCFCCQNPTSALTANTCRPKKCRVILVWRRSRMWDGLGCVIAIGLVLMNFILWWMNRPNFYLSTWNYTTNDFYMYSYRGHWE